MHQVHSAYQAGRYASAQRGAEKILMSGPVKEKDEAAYMAGLAAYQMNNTVIAQQRFERAAASQSPDLAGDALVMLGLIYSQEHNHEQAVRAFSNASTRLTNGQDRANAHFHAAKSQQHLGRWAEARASLSLARSNSSDLTFRRQVAQELKVTGFTLQAGAFGNQVNANQAAENLFPQASTNRLGRPRVVSAVDQHGRSLFLVQVGQFSSHASAQSIRTKLGKPSLMIVPLAGDN